MTPSFELLVPELGHFALILSLGLGFILAVLPFVGARTHNIRLMQVARPAAMGQFVLILIAYLALTWCFLSHDFSVRYVNQHSNTDLPTMYRIAAVWGSHEGSLLLWSLILSLWTVAVAVFSRSLPLKLRADVLAVMGAVSIGFLLFMLFTSNPFERQFPAPLNGRDLNPLLQDPGMAIHPPMLYMGYVGFSVAFAFAFAALIQGRLDTAWARWTRPWTTAAWAFLTFGIVLGSWWAYNELGWGGWWFWDPVENASFMPWLVGTALIHSLAVTEQRGLFKGWTVLLALTAFALSLLGTFLVRSGVLVSVHAFATDPARGVFILIFMSIVVVGSLMLYAWRAPILATQNNAVLRLFSREGFLLLNNIFLTTAAAMVLFGTLYPILASAFGYKLSVGPPYFNLMFAILALPLVAMVGFAYLLRWRKDSWQRIAPLLALPVGLSVAAALIFPWVFGHGFAVGLAGALILAFWAMTTAVAELLRRWRTGNGLLAGMRRTPRAVYGQCMAHFGVGVFVLGVGMTMTHSIERDVGMTMGDVESLAGYELTFDGVTLGEGPNYQAEVGLIRVAKDGQQISRIRTEKRHYFSQEAPMTDAGIDVKLHRDIYISLGESLGAGAFGIRLYYRPFVRCIWLGGIIMMLGGLLAITDRRYRLEVRSKKTAKQSTAAAIT